MALTLAGVLAAVGVGYAAIPSADGVIHSCYDASSLAKGQLRVIDVEAGAKCSKTEKALNFNQTGPKGDSGGITRLIAGDGLSGGGTAGDVTLAADLASVQRRIASSCAVDSAIRAVAQDGTVTCQALSAPPAQAVEAFHEVGAAGEPAFENGWSNNFDGFTTAAFYKDPFGVVHLKGVVLGSTGSTVFTLPAAYRPANRLRMVDYNGTGEGTIDVFPTGEVFTGGARTSFQYVSMESMTWRAGE